MGVKHSKVSAEPDGPDSVQVQASDWNALHLNDAESANQLLAGPASGAPAVPGFRALVDADIPAAVARDSELHAALTVSGIPNYITLVGQDIVRALIDLASHVTGLLPWAKLDKGGSSLADLATRPHSALSDAPATAHHANVNDPTAGEKAALPGTSGVPGAGNKYVTNADPRNSDTRTPTSHDDTKHSDGPNEKTVNKGAANGYASLDADALVPDAQIPSGVMRDAEHTAIGDAAPHHAQSHGAAQHSAESDAAAIHDNVAGEIAALTEKATPVNADLLVIEDSAAANAKKKVQVGNLPAAGKIRNAITVPVKNPLPGIANDAAAQPLLAPFALTNCTKLKAIARDVLGTTATFRVTIAGVDKGSVTINATAATGTATVAAFSVAEDDEVDVDETAGGVDAISVAVEIIGEQAVF